MVISGDRQERSIPQENRQRDKGERLKQVDTEPKKMGRPRKPIDKTEFEKLCALQCTLEEVCGWFGITDVTLNTWCKENYEGRTFSEVFAEKRVAGKISLRRNMIQLASKNATMAIFLAKNWLGMTDNVEVKADTSLMQSLLEVVANKDTGKEQEN